MCNNREKTVLKYCGLCLKKVKQSRRILIKKYINKFSFISVFIKIIFFISFLLQKPKNNQKLRRFVLFEIFIVDLQKFWASSWLYTIYCLFKMPPFNMFCLKTLFQSIQSGFLTNRLYFST